MFKKGKPLAYIAGPITGLPNRNIEAFREARIIAEYKGYRAIIPHDLFNGIDTTSYQHSDYMRRCLRALLAADVIILLRGWNYSKGAKQELNLAMQMGIDFEYCWTLETIDKAPTLWKRLKLRLRRIENGFNRHFEWFLNPEKNYKNQTLH